MSDTCRRGWNGAAYAMILLLAVAGVAFLLNQAVELFLKFRAGKE